MTMRCAAATAAQLSSVAITAGVILLRDVDVKLETDVKRGRSVSGGNAIVSFTV